MKKGFRKGLVYFRSVYLSILRGLRVGCLRPCRRREVFGKPRVSALRAKPKLQLTVAT